MDSSGMDVLDTGGYMRSVHQRRLVPGGPMSDIACTVDFPLSSYHYTGLNPSPFFSPKRSWCSRHHVRVILVVDLSRLPDGGLCVNSFPFP